MILNIKNTKNKSVKVYSYNGIELPGVFYFNTKTGTTKMYLTGKHPGGLKYMGVVTTKVPTKGKPIYKAGVVKLSLKLSGAYAVVNGKKVG